MLMTVENNRLSARGLPAELHLEIGHFACHILLQGIDSCTGLVREDSSAKGLGLDCAKAGPDQVWSRVRACCVLAWLEHETVNKVFRASA